ncbi:putative disease resistance protein RGA3 [Musa acuminata AAA Group]|uniref:putative disease resistance protein RGA3 n=1 Tax=Musa acuminata AAA Group TaxID=214697 RepID=UPI0031DB1ED2
MIQAVLNDAEERQQIRNAVKHLLNELSQAAYDANDILDEVATERQRRQLIKYASVRNFLAPINPKRELFNREICIRVKDREHRLDSIARRCPLSELTQRSAPLRQQSYQTTSLTPSLVLGRESDMRKIKNMLLPLAEDFDTRSITKTIIESIDGFRCDFVSLDNLQKELGKKLSGRRYLLVLDDVWHMSPQDWERIKNFLYSGAQGSKIIVTTRIEEDANFMATSPPYHLEGLSNDECWCLVCQYALARDRNAMVDVDPYKMYVVNKCTGLPMAAIALGCRLSRETDRSKWSAILQSEAWESTGVDGYISDAVSLSYQILVTIS